MSCESFLLIIYNKMSMSDVESCKSQIKLEHSYALPGDFTAETPIENENRIKTEIDPENSEPKQKVLCIDNPEETPIEFVSVTDLYSVTNNLDDDNQVWRDDEAPNIDEGSIVNGKDPLFHIVRVQDVGKGQSIPQDPEEEPSENTSCVARLRDIKNLKRQLRIVKGERDEAKNQLKTLTQHCKSVEYLNERLRHDITSVNNDRSMLVSRLKDIEKKLTAKEVANSDLQIKCKVLTKELESSTKKYIVQATELSKEKLDLEIIETWLKDSLRSRHIFKEKLVTLNEDLQNFNKIRYPDIHKYDRSRLRAKIKSSLNNQKKQRHFYVSERERLLGKQEDKWKEIELELDVLLENLSLPNYAMYQGQNNRNFIERGVKNIVK